MKQPKVHFFLLLYLFDFFVTSCELPVVPFQCKLCFWIGSFNQLPCFICKSLIKTHFITLLQFIPTKSQKERNPGIASLLCL